jgi:hypothetical protein
VHTRIARSRHSPITEYCAPMQAQSMVRQRVRMSATTEVKGRDDRGLDRSNETIVELGSKDVVKQYCDIDAHVFGVDAALVVHRRQLLQRRIERFAALFANVHDDEFDNVCEHATLNTTRWRVSLSRRTSRASAAADLAAEFSLEQRLDLGNELKQHRIERVVCGKKKGCE